MPTGDRPDVSVIIPSFNGAKWIPDAIASVRAQTGLGVEIILVDDGSTDDTRATAERLAGDDLVCLQQTNQGLAAARNAGIAASRGRYLKFLDADDLLIPGALRRQVEWMDGNRAFSIVAGNSYRTIGDKPFRRITFPAGEVPLSRIVVSNPFPVHSLLYRSDVFTDGFRFENSLRCVEDWDLLARAMIAGARMMHRAEDVCFYRTFAVSMSSNSDAQTHGTLVVIARIFENPNLPDKLRDLESKAVMDAASHGVAKACSEGNRIGAAQWMSLFLSVEGSVAAWPQLVPRVVIAERNPRTISRADFVNTFLEALPGEVDQASARKQLEAAILVDDVARAREFGTQAEAAAALARLLSTHPRHALKHYRNEVKKRLR